VPEDVKPRVYRSRRRAESAARTRERIVAAARELLCDKGYAGTTVVEVARAAGVSVDTLYASVGRKPQLVLTVVDDILGEGQGAVPAAQRTYVAEVQAAVGLRAKVATYASALGRLQPELAPLLRALAFAGEEDAACAAAFRHIDERRAANMRLLAADLRATGELRPDLDDAAVADLVWSTNSWEYFELLRRRGFTPSRYAAHLADLWFRALAADPTPTPSVPPRRRKPG
jgi:AcrR family transcriptional regulator